MFPSNPINPRIISIFEAVHKIFFGLYCLAFVSLILFFFITFIRHLCYRRPLRDYFTMFWITISSILSLFIKFVKWFFYGLILANVVVIVAIILFVFTHSFLVKTGFVADSFKIAHMNIELNSENKFDSIRNLLFLTLLFDVGVFSLISYNLSETFIMIFSSAYYFVICFLIICSADYTPELFFNIINDLCKYILHTTIKPFHILSLFTVDLINFFCYIVKIIGFSLPVAQVPILFPCFFESLGFKSDTVYSRIDWLIFTADICVTIIFSYMVIFSEDELVVRLKGEMYVYSIIIFFLIVLLFISFHMLGIYSLLSSCILPESISSFSDFVDYFYKYAEDKKPTYREGSNTVYRTLTLEDLSQEMYISNYDLIESVMLYDLYFTLILFTLMLLFIYLGIPYFCAKKFDYNRSLYKVHSSDTFPYGYPVCLDYLKKRASLNMFYILFVVMLFFLFINVYPGSYAKHIFIFCMSNIGFLYVHYCYIVLHLLTFFALGPFVLNILLSHIVVTFVVLPSFFFTMFLFFYLRLIPITGLFSPFYDGDWSDND